MKGTLAGYLVQPLALNSTHLLAQCLHHGLFMKTSKRFWSKPWSFLGQTVPVFDQPHCDLFIFLKSNWNFSWYNCVYCPLSFLCAPVEASSVFSITIYLTPIVFFFLKTEFIQISQHVLLHDTLHLRNHLGGWTHSSLPTVFLHCSTQKCILILYFDPLWWMSIHSEDAACTIS